MALLHILIVDAISRGLLTRRPNYIRRDIVHGAGLVLLVFHTLLHARARISRTIG